MHGFIALCNNDKMTTVIFKYSFTTSARLQLETLESVRPYDVTFASNICFIKYRFTLPSYLNTYFAILLTRRVS